MIERTFSQYGPYMWLLLIAWLTLSLIEAWIRNHPPNEAWGEFIYPFPNFNGCTVEVCEWISYFILHFINVVNTYLY